MYPIVMDAGEVHGQMLNTEVRMAMSVCIFLSRDVANS